MQLVHYYLCKWDAKRHPILLIEIAVSLSINIYVFYFEMHKLSHRNLLPTKTNRCISHTVDFNRGKRSSSSHNVFVERMYYRGLKGENQEVVCQFFKCPHFQEGKSKWVLNLLHIYYNQ